MYKKWFLFIAILSSAACFADVSFKLDNSIEFTKSNLTVEHLDHGNFRGTAATTDWIANKEFKTFVLKPELYWVGKKFYVLGAVNYGWVLSGNTCSYPQAWDDNGHTKGFEVETGYIISFHDRFKLVTYVGYEYQISNTKLKHQHLTHSSPQSFISQNGNRSETLLYNPYIGIEFDFKARLWGCHDMQFLVSYQFGYRAGHGRNKVHDTVITDNPNTSRYGSTIKFRDIISHEFEVAGFYPLGKHWQIGLELDYFTAYNTHRLPLKLHHNEEIVEAGQYTRSQFHKVNDYNTQTFSIILAVIYNFSGGTQTIVK